MKDIFSQLIIVELAGVLAGPSAGLFFAELGAEVIKIENPETGGDVTRSWKLPVEEVSSNESAYYWSVNAGKKVVFLNLKKNDDLVKLYKIIETADIVISNYKKGDDIKLKVDYDTLKNINSKIIYASINGFGTNSLRTAYDLILQAESGFMFINGEKDSAPLKMPVALIDILAGHQLKEAILIALIKRSQTNQGINVSVSLFETAISSLSNQATNWLIANELPTANGSLHPNIAPYGEIFKTKDEHLITFAIGSDGQFQNLCKILGLNLYNQSNYASNQLRIKNRENLFKILEIEIKKQLFTNLYESCITQQIPIGKIRSLKDVFELPEAQKMLNTFAHNNKMLTSVKSIGFTLHE